MTAKSFCRAVLLVARSVSHGGECPGCSRRTSLGTSAGPRTSTAACPIAALSCTGQTFRGTCRQRWGRSGFYGASYRCRWARRQRAVGAVGAEQRVLVWATSSCVSGRAVVSPGGHQPGRLQRTKCRRPWCWRMCSCRPRSQSCCRQGCPVNCCRLTGGQLRPTDTEMATGSARTSSSEEDARSTDKEDRSLSKRCIERQWKNTFLRVKRLPCDHESDGQTRASEKRSKVGSIIQFSFIARETRSTTWVKDQGPRP